MKEPIKQYKPAEKLELPKLEKESPKKYKQISCPACNNTVTADQINLDKDVAKCGSCHVVFSIAEELSSLGVKNKMKQEIFRPEGIDLFYYKDEMEITVEQRVHTVDGVGTFFSLLGLLIALLLSLKDDLMLYYSAVFAMSTLLFFYRLFSYTKAKSHIDINDRSLTIRHRPKNFKSDRSYAAADIDQVYLKDHGDGVNISVYMIVNGPGGQRHEKLLVVKTLSKAKYLEQKIEKYLGIVDRKVLESNV